MHKVLVIETSCDETSVSIVSNTGDTFKIHSNIIASQIEDHSKSVSYTHLTLPTKA